MTGARAAANSRQLFERGERHSRAGRPLKRHSRYLDGNQIIFAGGWCRDVESAEPNNQLSPSTTKHSNMGSKFRHLRRFVFHGPSPEGCPCMYKRHFDFFLLGDKHLSLAAANHFSRFLLRGTQGSRRHITAHARGPPGIRGVCNRRLKLPRLARFRWEPFRTKQALAGYTKIKRNTFDSSCATHSP